MKYEDDRDLVEILKTVYRRKFVILSVSFLFFLAAAMYSLTLPNIYKSQIILAPNSNDTRVGGSLEVLTSFSGISLGGEQNLTDEAIVVMKSFDFFNNYISKYIEPQDLIAVKSWDQKNNKLIYDNEQYDEETQKWTRSVSYPKTETPNGLELHKYFLNEIFLISEERGTGFVTLTIEHPSASWGKNLLDQIAADINKFFVERDRKKINNSLTLLQDELERSRFENVKSVVTESIKSNLNQLIIIDSSEEYVFKVLSSAYAPQYKSSPSRTIISLIGLFIGFLLSIIIIITREFKPPNLKQ
jgi:LPS O-antigen subunit length determinant protein (WzzB/FepE family)